MERIRLYVRMLALLLVVVLVVLTGLSHQAASNSVDGPPVNLDRRLGEDDGALLAILFGANLRGLLLPCDCNVPRGGLARRIGYVDAFKARFKNTPVIHVDAGFFLSTGQSARSVLQNDQVVRGYSRWPVDVLNLGRNDLSYAKGLLAVDGLAERRKALPIIENLISANGVFNEGTKPPPPYVVKEIISSRLSSKRRKLRVGFLGLAGPIKVGEGIDATVTDMYRAARRYVPELRRRCDILVILAHSDHGEALRLAQENPEANIVIAGNAETVFQPRQVGRTVVVCAAPGQTQLGDLRIYAGKGNEFSYKFLSTDLDAGVPSNPDAEDFVRTAMGLPPAPPDFRF